MEFDDASPLYGTAYLLGPVLAFAGDLPAGARVLDLGCGNGFWAGLFARRGCTVVGIDSSHSGIELARSTHVGVRFEVMDIEPDLLGALDEDPFDLVVSTEVIEHLYSPQTWADACFHALRPGGTIVVSTPYHGWLKNVALAATGKLDRHLDALREGGHIKFFSRRVLSELLSSRGFVDIRFAGAGRAPFMWKSMVLAATKPA
jgi:2-polyprenyl-6-hydroxyphenyl methylase/3-demethylubiquinone-9 3-methyltransferase